MVHICYLTCRSLYAVSVFLFGRACSSFAVPSPLTSFLRRQVCVRLLRTFTTLSSSVSVYLPLGVRSTSPASAGFLFLFCFSSPSSPSPCYRVLHVAHAARSAARSAGCDPRFPSRVWFMSRAIFIGETPRARAASIASFFALSLRSSGSTDPACNQDVFAL